MKGNRSVVKGLLMVTQIGISMIVPIFLGVFLGYKLDQCFGTGFFLLVFLLFGILAAFRNIYKLTKPFYAEDLKREQAEQAYWDSLKKERQSGLQPAQTRGDGVKTELQPGQTHTDGLGEQLRPDGAVASGTKEKMASGIKERRKRMQLCGERRTGDGEDLLKSRREAAEEEFAAWRRERGENHDGGVSHDKAANHDSAVCGDKTGRSGAK